MKIVTHSGAFHADDIFAVATLLLVYPTAEVVRSRDPEVIKTGDIVVDVGEINDPGSRRFDHHQKTGAGARANGIPYASFGLVWKEFGEQIAHDHEAKAIVDEKLVSSIDALDNGVEISTPRFPGVRSYSIIDYLYSYVDPKNTDDAYLLQTFLVLVGIAKDLIVRESAAARSEAEDGQKVDAIVAATVDKRIIVIDEPLAWGRALARATDVLYLIYPRKEGSWGLRAVPQGPGSFEVRKPLPEAWIGKTAEELSALTGVPDAMFMHRGQWLAAARSKEGARTLAQIALTS